jgi:2-phospho-L-lactate/phosphoenolpyruvate guanylyltransferase
VKPSMLRAKTWIVVPVKNIELAKQRLASRLDCHQRQELSLAMLADVLATLQLVKHVSGIAVITRDSKVREFALARQVRVLAETATGINAAVNEASKILSEEGCATMVVVPADVPLATPTDFESVIAAHADGETAVTLVADRNGTGTNLLACSPPAALQPSFGENSMERHREAAREARLTTTILDLPNLSLDVDSPADLVLLMAQGRRCKTTEYLKQIHT